ncbi:hypothetical protein GCM10009534_05430 [Kribbella sandramycini]
MGKTLELDRAQQLAAQRGWTAIRVEASAREPLEHRLTRAITDDMGTLRKQFGRFQVRKLKRAVRELTQRHRKVQHGAEVRIGGGPVQFVTKRQWDATPSAPPGTTLTDVADQLGELADKPVLLLVDNVDAASASDLAGLNELAGHLQQRGQPVWLVAAGGALTASRIQAVSGRVGFDIRELGIMSADELRPALTVPLERAGVPYERAGVEGLLRAANGDPSRLRTLADTALELTDPRTGLTGAVAAAAAARVEARSAVLYQGRWQKCTDGQKELLARVAAQGVNGLSMPAETEATANWQPIDQARQELVARGLLRERGEYVDFAEGGMRDWVNGQLDQTPAAPALVAAAARQQVAVPVARRAVGVFGATREPAYRVDRRDGEGRPISLHQRTPTSTTVLFTGAPGMGKSHELDRTAELAARQGWKSLRVDASPREPLENRLVRAISQDLDSFRDHYGFVAARGLKKDLDKLASRSRNPQSGNEVRIGVPGAFQFVAKEQHDSERPDPVGGSLNDLADRLGALAKAKGEPIVLMIDNLDAASERDLIDFTELAARLEQNRQPVFLVGAGGEQLTSRLLAASGGRSGVESDVVTRFDIRTLAPFTDAELRPTLTEPLRQAGIPHTPEAVDHLLTAANGNPARLRALAATADVPLTLTTAKAATAHHAAISRPHYEAAWHNCTPAEKSLLTKAAHLHPTGIPLPPATQARWTLESTASRPLTQGLLRQTPTHLTLPDPAFATYLQSRLRQTGLTPPQPTPTANDRHTPRKLERSGRPLDLNR